MSLKARLSFLLATAVLSGASSVLGQQPEFQLETILRGPEGEGFSEPGYLLATNRFRQGWLVNSRQDLYYFGEGGDFLTEIGRAGQGPGEWSAVVWVAVRGDSAAVFDLGNGRVSILGPELTVARSFPFGSIGLDGALWLPDGRFVVTAGFQEDPERLGFAMAFLSADGELGAPFDEYTMLPGVHSAERKRYLQLVGDTIVALSQNDGTVRYWDLDGSLVGNHPVARDPAGWSASYTETSPPRLSPDQTPPSSFLSALDVHHWRLLGLMTPAQAWKDGFDGGAIDLERVFRGSVQLIDKTTQKVVHEQFVPFLPVLFTRDFLVSPRVDDLGFTMLEIRSVTIHPTPESMQ